MMRMSYIIAILGFLMLSTVLWDAFELIILPRRVIRRFRFARFFYRFTWRLRSVVPQWIPGCNRSDTCLSIFGPLSLLLLMGVWLTGLIVGFAMLQFGLQDRLNVVQSAASFGTYLY